MALNNLEQIIFSRGLENTYRHALLGREEQALSGIENLIYLTRKLSDDAPIKQSLSEETALLARICDTCWPELKLDIQMEPGTELAQADRGCVSAQICKVLSELIPNGNQPKLLRLYRDCGEVQYDLLSEDRLCAQGVVSDG